jgi:hypothetical protein
MNAYEPAQAPYATEMGEVQRRGCVGFLRSTLSGLRLYQIFKNGSVSWYGFSCGDGRFA